MFLGISWALAALGGCAAALNSMDVQMPIDTSNAVDASADSDVNLQSDQPMTMDAMAHDHGRIGSHGMLLTGAGSRLYLSHLPAFYEPHRAQVVVEGQWASPPPGLPSDFSTELYSFSPESLSLDALRDGALTSLRGTVFRGNFEQGGSTLASDVRFAVTRVVYQSELGTTADSQQGYLIFGQPDALFAVHRITAEPGFDHLLRVRVDPPLATTDLTSGAVLLRRATSDVVDNRLQNAGQFLSSTGATHTVTPIATLSCLLGPGFSTVCP